MLSSLLSLVNAALHVIIPSSSEYLGLQDLSSPEALSLVGPSAVAAIKVPRPIPKIASGNSPNPAFSLVRLARRQTCKQVSCGTGICPDCKLQVCCPPHPSGIRCCENGAVCCAGSANGCCWNGEGCDANGCVFATITSYYSYTSWSTSYYYYTQVSTYLSTVYSTATYVSTTTLIQPVTAGRVKLLKRTTTTHDNEKRTAQPQEVAQSVLPAQISTSKIIQSVPTPIDSSSPNTELLSLRLQNIGLIAKRASPARTVTSYATFTFYSSTTAYLTVTSFQTKFTTVVNAITIPSTLIIESTLPIKETSTTTTKTTTTAKTPTSSQRADSTSSASATAVNQSNPGNSTNGTGNTTNQSSGLSLGAKIGIGIGAAFFVLGFALTFLKWCLKWHHGRKEPLAPVVVAAGGLGGPAPTNDKYPSSPQSSSDRYSQPYSPHSSMGYPPQPQGYPPNAHGYPPPQTQGYPPQMQTTPQYHNPSTQPYPQSWGGMPPTSELSSTSLAPSGFAPNTSGYGITPATPQTYTPYSPSGPGYGGSGSGGGGGGGGGGGNGYSGGSPSEMGTSVGDQPTLTNSPSPDSNSHIKRKLLPLTALTALAALPAALQAGQNSNKQRRIKRRKNQIGPYHHHHLPTPFACIDPTVIQTCHLFSPHHICKGYNEEPVGACVCIDRECMLNREEHECVVGEDDERVDVEGCGCGDRYCPVTREVEERRRRGLVKEGGVMGVRETARAVMN